MQPTVNSVDKKSNWTAWHLLFILEFAMVLWPPFFNKMEPTAFGMPFFYWYQLACVFVGAVITAIVYFRSRT